MSPTRPVGALAPIVLASGAAALAYEVLAARVLAPILGGAAPAQAATLALLLGGMGLGYRAFGAAADRSARPLALFGRLEAGAAAWAAAWPAAGAFADAAVAGFAPATPAGALARLAATAALILPLGFLLGGGLPALGRHLATSLADLPRVVARLYALQGLGAAAGALAASFVLLPRLGVAGGLWAAAAVGALAAAAALRLAAGPEAGPATPPADDAPGPAAIAPAAALATAFGLGVATLWLETAATRALTVAVGASAHAFAIMAAAFVAGTAAGAWLVARGVGRDLRPGEALVWALLAAGGGALAILPVYQLLPPTLFAWRGFLGLAPGAYPWWVAAQLVAGLAVFTPAAIGIGAAAPHLARFATPTAGAAGRGIGRAFAAAAAGNAVGAVTAPWLLPIFGLRGLVVLAAMAALALAAIHGLRVGAPRASARTLALAGMAALALVAGGLGDQWDPRLGAVGLLRASDVGRATWEETRHRAEARTVRWYRDDAEASVAVLGTGSQLTLVVDGKPDASTGEDLATQALLAHVPLALHERPRSALVVGLGAGFTAGAALAHPLERLDVCELVPAVVDANELFAAANGAVLDDPRVRLHRADARAFVRAAGARWDVVVSEPSNPWVAGNAALFAREWYADVARALAPGGVFAQWVHAYEMDDATLATAIRTMGEVFPRLEVWQGGRDDLILVARAAEGPPDLAGLPDRLARPAVAGDLARAGVAGPLPFLACQVLPAGEAVALAGPGPVHTLGRPVLEFGAARAFFEGASAGVVAGADRRTAAFTPGSGLWLDAWLARRGRPPAAAEYRALADLAARQGAPAWRRRALAAWAVANPRDPRPRWAMAGLEAQAGRFAAAEAALRAARALAPADPTGLVAAAELAVARIDAGDAAAAQQAGPLLEGLWRVEGPEAARARWIAALLHLARGDVDGTLAAADAFVAVDPGVLLDPPGARRLVRLWRAAAFKARGNGDRTREAAAWRKIVAHDTTDAEARHALIKLEVSPAP